jgi:hypothetical protein
MEHVMPDQNAFDFITEAKKTASNKFHARLVEPAELYNAMKDAILALDKVDAMRKSLFYGRELPEFYRANLAIGTQEYPDTSKVSPMLIHGILGAACEGGEKLDILVRCFDGEQFDRTNYIEECGDGFWFDAIGLDNQGADLEGTMKTCIAKLRARSGAKFTELAFNERDLITEREVLEKNAMPDSRGDKVRVNKEEPE